MPVASLSWVPPRVYPTLPSSSPLILPPPVPPYPASSLTSDQFPCLRLGPNGELGPTTPGWSEATENLLKAPPRRPVVSRSPTERN